MRAGASFCLEYAHIKSAIARAKKKNYYSLFFCAQKDGIYMRKRLHAHSCKEKRFLEPSRLKKTNFYPHVYVTKATVSRYGLHLDRWASGASFSLVR